MQEEAGMDLRRLEKSAANSRALAEARALCERVGKTWEDAYRIAAQELRGTPAYGSPATIKASYQLVKKMFRVPETAPRFMPLKSETLRRFGIRDIR